MARDPGSVWKPLSEAGAPDGHTKTQFIVHSTGTMATAAANWNYFQRPDVVVESTFIVGWGPDDPTLQIMDSTDNADANGSANRRGISVEVVGDGVGPYTDWQIRELIRLGRWAASTHPIERRIIPSEAASGFGWHVMFGAPGPWTTVRGKVCPGVRRIAELKSTVFPAIFGGTPQEDDMDITELYGWRDNGGRNLVDFQNYTTDVMGQLARALKEVQASVAELRKTVTTAGGAVVGGGPSVAEIADAVNDEADRRDRDGDPATGPVS